MNANIVRISETIKHVFLDSLPTENLISIFLCGGNSIPDAKFRRQLGLNITKIHSKYQYSVFYPEDMFIELILGHQRKNLLKLENLLAIGVHCVVILLQSPGTFTELGAFANYEDLKHKLVVVIEPKYRLKRSFISLGPLRYLLSDTNSQVIYTEIKQENLNVLTKTISEASREIAKHSSPVNDLSNPITSRKFYLAMIYVFDPIDRKELFEIVSKISNNDPETTITVAESVLNGLISERKALSVSDKLSITPKGVDTLIYDTVLKNRSHRILSSLSHLRLEALNLRLRGRRYIKTGGAIVA